MSALACPTCRARALADDEFCETCGAPVGRDRAAARRHVEIDVGSAAAVSDVGLVHERNDDAVHLRAARERLVAVVCDGVSSAAGSQVAAAVAADAIGEVLWSSPLDPVARMAEAVRTAGRRVAGLDWSDEDGDPPSCTAVAALVEDGTIVVGWAGDSRAYWVTAGGECLLTHDHSWAQAQVDAGAMVAEDAMRDRRAHAIARWLGADQPDDDPAVTTFVPPSPGHLMLCSDGLWNEVDVSADVLAGDRRPLELARLLTHAALACGGHDNISVVVAEIKP